MLFKVFVLKLVANDIPLLVDVFPGVECSPVDLDKLTYEIKNGCQEKMSSRWRNMVGKSTSLNSKITSWSYNEW